MILNRMRWAMDETPLFKWKIGAARRVERSSEPLAPRSFCLSYRLQNSRYESFPKPGVTLESIFQLPSEPCMVRLIYMNDQPEGWSVDGAAVTTMNHADLHSPDNILAGEGGAWKRVTFTGCGAGNDFTEAVDQTALSLNIPPNHREAGQPAMALSDWVDVHARPTKDGSQGHLLRVRTYSRGYIRYSGAVGMADRALRQATGGGWIEGDATDGSSAGPFHASDRIFACYGVQYVSAVRGVTIAGIGDSIMHSSCTTGELSGFGIRSAVRLSRPNCPVSYVSDGYPGRNSLGYITCGAWDITHLRPQAALIQTYSQNEPWTEEMANIAFSRALFLADLAQKNDCIPILTTPAPVCQRTPEADVHRRRTVERVRSLQATGVAILDLDRVWGTGSIPNKYWPDYDAGDTWHPNDAACAHAADELTQILQDLLAL